MDRIRIIEARGFISSGLTGMIMELATGEEIAGILAAALVLCGFVFYAAFVASCYFESQM